jgi:hypothetical protein
MDKLLIKAAKATLRSGDRYSQKQVSKFQERQARRSHLVKYAGTRNGITYGQLANGKEIPITARSNGALERGETFITSNNSGIWMPS